MDHITVKFSKSSYTLTKDEYEELFRMLDNLRDTIQCISMAQIKKYYLNPSIADELDNLLARIVKKVNDAT